MAKKILKVASLGLIGGKKKSAPETPAGQPIITQIDPEATKRGRRPRPKLGGTILGDLSGTLGG